MPRILLTQSIHPDAEARFRDLGELVTAPDQSATTLRRLAADADAMVVRAQLPDDIFDAAPRLLAAVRHGAGVDMIPIPQATAHGVLVTNAPGTNAQSVAEYVAGSMVTLARRLDRIGRDLRDPAKGWSVARAHADHGRELAGSTLGIVGFGRVGRALARIAAHGFGMTVLAANRTPMPAPLDAAPVGLDELLARSDWVVLTIALTDATRGMIDRQRIARMKRGAFLINVARGPIVDEDALVEALGGGRLAGAALDVFRSQPLAQDHPLRGLDNVLLTPHLAGITEPAMVRMGLTSVDAVADALAGRRPANLVNPEAWDGFVKRHGARG